MKMQMLAYQLWALGINLISMFLPQGWSGIGSQVGLGNSHPRSKSSLGASLGWVLSLPYGTYVSCFPSPSGLGQRTGFS